LTYSKYKELMERLEEMLKFRGPCGFISMGLEAEQIKTQALCCSVKGSLPAPPPTHLT
jgi:hypothetical protein